MSELTRPTRPIHRNINIGQIVAYRLPPSGIVSIFHRISGALLFLLLPFVLYLFDRSITSVGTFGAFKAFTSTWYAKVVLLVLLWAYIQHFLGGIRHLFLDLHLGVEKDTGRQTALSVLIGTAVLWVAFALKTVGVF